MSSPAPDELERKYDDGGTAVARDHRWTRVQPIPCTPRGGENGEDGNRTTHQSAAIAAGGAGSVSKRHRVRVRVGCRIVENRASWNHGLRAPPREVRDIGPLGDGDTQSIVFACIDVVGIEGASEPSRLEANDGVRPGIEGGVAAEDGKRDAVALQLVGAARQRFLDQESQEVASARAALKPRALKDALQLLANLVRRGLGGQPRALPTGCVDRPTHSIPEVRSPVDASTVAQRRPNLKLRGT